MAARCNITSTLGFLVRNLTCSPMLSVEVVAELVVSDGSTEERYSGTQRKGQQGKRQLRETHERFLARGVAGSIVEVLTNGEQHRRNGNGFPNRIPEQTI